MKKYEKPVIKKEKANKPASSVETQCRCSGSSTHIAIM